MATLSKTCFQKQSIGAESENCLAVINKKIAEIKKKIQLSEGQRKAYYEETDNANRQNVDKLNNIKKEIKKLTGELVKAKNELGGEKQFRLVKYLSEIGSIANKDHVQLKQILDLKVIDLHKQLDLMKYKRRRKKSELAKLEQEYQKLFSEKTKITDNKKKSQKSSKKAISQLENDIHRIAVQWMEAEHIRKKYTGIRYSLLNDSVKFESALAKVERMIKHQNEEINKLQEINRSAMQMRDSTMSSLLQHESRAANASGQREKQLQHFRNKVDDRKAELERLERKIFPMARPMLVQQDSIGSDLAPVEEENGSSMSGTNIDDIFQKLMKATGVSDPENVFDRFKAQQCTTERLVYLKNTMEEEKKHLETDQNLMLAEIESHKFAQVKDKEENQEEMEDLKNEIEKEKEKQKQLDIEEKKILTILIDIKRSFYDCCLKLEDADVNIIPDWSDDTSNLDEVLKLLKSKYIAASQLIEKPEPVKVIEEYLTTKPTEDRRRSRDITAMEKSPMEERNILPAAYHELLAPRTKSRGAGTPSGSQPKAIMSDEEEEIPSRGFLKRQAQLIVDTKSRRKGYRIPQMAKK